MMNPRIVMTEWTESSQGASASVALRGTSVLPVTPFLIDSDGNGGALRQHDPLAGAVHVTSTTYYLSDHDSNGSSLSYSYYTA